MPNARALIALGVAFTVGASTVPFITAGRPMDSVRPSTGSGYPTEAASGSRTWVDPIIAKSDDRPPSPRARPADGALQVERTLAGRRQTRPLVASIQEGPPTIVPPLVHRRPRADASPASKHPRLVGDAPAQRPVQRLAVNFQGQDTTRSVRGGDGLLRWLFER